MGDAPDREPPESPELEGARQRAPGDEPGFAGETELERARRLRRFSAWAQAGGIAFLAVVSLGLLPTVIGSVFPALGAKAALAVYVLAPVVPIALLVVAAVKLRR